MVRKIIATVVLTITGVSVVGAMGATQGIDNKKERTMVEKKENIFVRSERVIEDSVVKGYKAIENSVVSGYKAVEDFFVDNFFKEDPREQSAEETSENSAEESVEEA